MYNFKIDLKDFIFKNNNITIILKPSNFETFSKEKPINI